jgi:Tfp pilus assembly protein PilF
MEESSTVNVKVTLKSFDKDADRDSIVKMVKYFLKSNDDEADEFVDFLPNVLIESCPTDKANGLIEIMNQYGAIIELEKLGNKTEEKMDAEEVIEPEIEAQPTEEDIGIQGEVESVKELEENSNKLNSEVIPQLEQKPEPLKKEIIYNPTTTQAKIKLPKKKIFTKKRILTATYWILGVALLSLAFQYSNKIVLQSSPDIEEYSRQAMDLVKKHKLEMKKQGYKLRPDSALKTSKEGRKAYAIMKKATKKHPKESESWRTLGFIQKEMGLEERALKSYEKAIKHSPESPENHLAMAGLLQEKELYGKAEFQLRKGLRHNPKNSELLKGMAILHRYHLGDSAKALAWLFHYQLRAKGKGYDPDKMQLGREALTLALDKFGTKKSGEVEYSEFEKSRRKLEAKLKQSPKNQVLREKMADLFMDKGYDERAGKVYNKLLSENPKAASRLEEKVARVYFKQDKPQAALTRLKRACLKAKTPSVTACRKLFLVEKYWKLDPKGAYKAWEIYDSMGGDEYQDLLKPELLELKLLEG